MLVSKTDLKGVITYCNRAFLDVSGYEDRELIGEPHNIVRHPDVPPEVFADLWSTIKAGSPWNGVVKNRCKNGDSYWVEANVTPLHDGGKIIGYVSLRYKASEEQIAAAENVYQAVREGLPIMQLSSPDLGYIVQLQQRLADKFMDLERYQERNEEELRLGSFIMERMLKIDDSLNDLIHRYTNSATQIGGDVLIAAKTPANVVHVMLADAVGHGLAAAINVLPVCRAFYDLTAKGFSIEQIAADLNELVNHIMPADRFVSMALLSINFNAQAIEVWNGGIPALRLLGREGKFLHNWSSRHLPLGILDSKQFSAKPEIFHYEEGCQLYLFSDGLVEACCPKGRPFSDDRLLELLSKTPGERRFAALVEDFEAHLDGGRPHDDVSFAMVDLTAGSLKTLASSKLEHGVESEPGDWRVAIRLGASELKYLDVVPLVTQLLTKVRSAREHHSALFLILSELFNNALDHGVLQLDSRLKRGIDGFEHYLQLREVRMQALEHGEVSIEVESAIVEGSPAVKIHITDSGEGFDYRLLQSAAGGEQHGRGIALTRSLARKLEYAGRGNEVTAYYICS